MCCRQHCRLEWRKVCGSRTLWRSDDDWKWNISETSRKTNNPAIGIIIVMNEWQAAHEPYSVFNLCQKYYDVVTEIYFQKITIITSTDKAGHEQTWIISPLIVPFRPFLTFHFITMLLTLIYYICVILQAKRLITTRHPHFPVGQLTFLILTPQLALWTGPG